jgi:hypothetical protein
MTAPVRLFYVHAVDENFVRVKISDCSGGFLEAH